MLFRSANWTQDVGGDGSIDTSGAPASIVLNGSDDYTSGLVNTDFSIAAPSAGTVSFKWDYITSDSAPGYDHFGYLLNGSYTKLVDGGGSTIQSGSTSFPVLAGDVFGFRQNSEDSTTGRAATTISSFNFGDPSTTVPGPLPLLGAGAAFGWSRRLRNRRRASWLTPPQA